jgi:hypothetical protein
MAFKMNGSPAKTGTISGTAGHSSALKQLADVEKQKESMKKTAEARAEKGLDSGKKMADADWAKGVKKSGGTLNELVSARKKHKKGSAEYAEIQNKINKSLGSKKVHTVTKTTKSGETEVVKPKGTTTRKSDDKTIVKGLGAQKGKTLEYTRKVAEKEKISKEKGDIKEAKKTGDKVEKAQSQKEISQIKSGRDDAKTGTVVSRAWHKARAKRKARKEAKLKAKNA